MSWGTKIAILYIGFVAMIVALVVKSSQQNTDLVSADYYAQELKFQDKINGQKNLSDLATSIACEAEENAVLITLPQELRNSSTIGEILIYRPSDAQLDIKQDLNTDVNGNQRIQSKLLKRGLYKIQLSCNSEGKNYFFEKEIFYN